MDVKYRKHIRLKNYDYKANGYYFVTICTDYRKQMFEPRISKKYGCKLNNDVVAGPWPAKFKENSDIVESKILNIENKFPAEIDFYCIMPDHIHMIVVLKNDCNSLSLANIKARQGRATTTLSVIINAFKGWCTRELRGKIWQPNYYEHVIRNERALEKIREYMHNNPEKEILEFEGFYE